MPNSVWFILAFVAFDLLMMAIIVPLIVRNTWRSLAAPYPPVEPRPDAVQRSFQSFRIGVINLGGCVHVAVDEDYLHLLPARLLRWFRVGPTSIPWSAIRLKRARRGFAIVRIDEKEVRGPAWCLELARSDSLDA